MVPCAIFLLFLNICLNFCNQFTWFHIKGKRNFPYGFKVGAFGSIFYHGKMCAGNSSKSTQQILGHTFLNAFFSDYFSNNLVVKLHFVTTLYLDKG